MRSFAQQQFRHAADGIYIEREKLEEIWDQLQAYMNGTVELLEVMELLSWLDMCLMLLEFQATKLFN
jgi:hypothetical protein